jgi:hypothetical protein
VDIEVFILPTGRRRKRRGKEKKGKIKTSVSTMFVRERRRVK